jgi:hypothetical protein
MHDIHAQNILIAPRDAPFKYIIGLCKINYLHCEKGIQKPYAGVNQRHYSEALCYERFAQAYLRWREL